MFFGVPRVYGAGGGGTLIFVYFVLVHRLGQLLCVQNIEIRDPIIFNISYEKICFGHMKE